MNNELIASHLDDLLLSRNVVEVQVWNVLLQDGKI
jgi:hypothetical protein